MKKKIIAFLCVVGMLFSSEMAFAHTLIEDDENQFSAGYYDEEISNNLEDEILSIEGRASSVIWSGSISCANGMAGFQKFLTAYWNSGDDVMIRVSMNNNGSESIIASLTNSTLNSVRGTVTITPGDTGVIDVQGRDMPKTLYQGTYTSNFCVKAVNADYNSFGPISGSVTITLFRFN